MKKAFLAVALVFAFSACAWAQEGGGAADEGPSHTVFTKIGRGVGNIVMAPFEVPVTAMHVAADTDIFVGASAGTVAGVAAGFERLFGGTAEVVTFLFPPYDRPVVAYELGKSPAASAAVNAFPKPDQF
ncbi:MAG: exosortase system-associated protein, TIGR04073 family [Candidatus Brocadiia bacterium]